MIVVKIADNITYCYYKFLPHFYLRSMDFSDIIVNRKLSSQTKFLENI